MSYAVCCVPVAPVRVNGNHKSEMISQFIFGECCIITFVEKDGWIKVVSKLDAYTGWCQQQHFQEIDEEHYNFKEEHLTANWVNEIDYNGHIMQVPLGSSLAAMQNGTAFWRKNVVHFSGKICNPAEEKITTKLVKQIAFMFLNTTYLWGGRSVFGVDCSGFTQLVFKFFGIALLRDAHQQITQGETVSFLQEARCGDLAFFDNEDGEIIHVGILLNQFEIIHASVKVRIDKIDNQGIINADNNSRTQKLRLIKRYF